ncbi:MAG: RloB domain-containing protein [Bacteroidia bacterium]|nr:RloB domain-containing protein [Bacteroidia bacterium]
MARKGKLNAKNKLRELIERPPRFRAYRTFYLVICEDENTEPYYFDQFKRKFPENTLFLKSIGTGFDPLGIIHEAIKQRNLFETLSQKEIDYIWAVFDKDDADLNEARMLRFEKAFKLAESEKINIAFSNECFELWLFLHLADVDHSHPLSRKIIYDLLEKIVIENYKGNFVYHHGDSEIVDIIARMGSETKAIERAQLLATFSMGKSRLETNPSTNVFELIQELRDWISFYNWEPGN